MAINIGGHWFKSKKNAIRYLEGSLRRYNIYDIANKKDTEMLTYLIQFKKWYENRPDENFIIKVDVTSVSNTGKRFMYISESRDFIQEISFKQCLSNIGMKSTNKQLDLRKKTSIVKKILRGLIEEYQMEQKDNYFRKNSDSSGRVMCAETGLLIERKDSHFDHYPKQFDEIIKDWVLENGISLSDIVLLEDDIGAKYLADDQLAMSFIDYHSSVVEYRVVLDKVNMQRPHAERFDWEVQMP